jgi:dTDP-4-amino-4,6-dideoxygalactose transaminase
VHRQQAYAHLEPAHLPVTDDVAGRVVSLTLFARLAPAAFDQTVEALVALHEHADEADAVVVT